MFNRHLFFFKKKGWMFRFECFTPAWLTIGSILKFSIIIFLRKWAHNEALFSFMTWALIISVQSIWAIYTVLYLRDNEKQLFKLLKAITWRIWRPLLRRSFANTRPARSREGDANPNEMSGPEISFNSIWSG